MDQMMQLQQNPFFQWWMSALQGQLRQMGTISNELQRLEEKSFEHARSAVDETARLTKEGLRAAGQLQAQWRKVALKATEHATETVA